MPGECQCIDLFFRNQKQDLMSPVAQDLSDGDSGKQMSSGSTTGDDSVHDWLFAIFSELFEPGAQFVFCSRVLKPPGDKCSPANLLQTSKPPGWIRHN